MTALYTVLAILFGLLALIALYPALRLLLNPHWILGFLRGVAGVILLALAVGVALIGLDMYSYRALLDEHPVATISFKREGLQRYRVTLLETEGSERTFVLQGDLWQLDVRLIKWRPAIAALGVKPGYQLDRLSGRYLTLEQDRSAERSVHALSQAPLDSLTTLWEMGRKLETWLPLVDARYGSAVYLPMSDNALYQISINANGLVSRPMNEPAEAAVAAW